MIYDYYHNPLWIQENKIIVYSTWYFGSPLTLLGKRNKNPVNSRRIMVQGSMVELAIKVELTYIFPQELYFHSMYRVFA